VARKANAADRRGVVIEATAEGKALLQKGRRRRVRMLAERLSQLPEAELAHVHRAIDTIQKALASKSG
jgi:DNA-binding MarR family transcriptional regulator